MDDLINRQAVLDMIEGFIADATSHGISARLDPYYVMDGIKDLPSVKPQESCDVPDTNVGDIISKQTVLDTISELNAISFYEAQEDSKECYYEIRQAIKDLSPVKPQTGHWVKGKCDQCGGHAPFWSMATTYYESEYCPKCGCRMVKPQKTKQPEISSYYGLKSYVRERSDKE